MKLLNIPTEGLQAKLSAYLAHDPKFKAVFNYTKSRFDEAKDLTAHNWAHAYRDTVNAIVIGEAEGADMSIVLPAATMHDIGFLYGGTGQTHGAVGADSLADYLNQGKIEYSTEQVKNISDCLRTHKGSMHNVVPESLEAKVVADADMLEKFGPFGIYQSIRTNTEFNWQLEEYLKRGTQILELTLETKTGQQLAEPGRQFVADFCRELAEAAEPYAPKEES